jgi:hypothetical protein
MVEEKALAQVHRRDLHHFIFGELEVEYIEDFSNAVRAHGLGDGDDVALDAPAQDTRGAPMTAERFLDRSYVCQLCSGAGDFAAVESMTR